MQIAKDETGCVLKLSGALRIDAAHELRAALLELVRTAPTPVVDLSEAAECDTAAFQLLLSACRTGERSGRPVELAGMSIAIREAGAALGLSFAGALSDSGTGGPENADGGQPLKRDSEDAI